MSKSIIIDGKSKDKLKKTKFKAQVIKISDDYYKGNHPNGVGKGSKFTGYTNTKPTKGERFLLIIEKLTIFSTSPVVCMLDSTTFKTLYSTYKIKYIKE